MRHTCISSSFSRNICRMVRSTLEKRSKMYRGFLLVYVLIESEFSVSQCAKLDTVNPFYQTVRLKILMKI